MDRGGLGVQSHLWLYRRFEASLGYMRAHLKNIKMKGDVLMDASQCPPMSVRGGKEEVGLVVRHHWSVQRLEWELEGLCLPRRCSESGVCESFLGRYSTHMSPCPRL